MSRLTLLIVWFFLFNINENCFSQESLICCDCDSINCDSKKTYHSNDQLFLEKVFCNEELCEVLKWDTVGNLVAQLVNIETDTLEYYDTLCNCYVIAIVLTEYSHIKYEKGGVKSIEHYISWSEGFILYENVKHDNWMFFDDNGLLVKIEIWRKGQKVQSILYNPKNIP